MHCRSCKAVTSTMGHPGEHMHWWNMSQTEYSIKFFLSKSKGTWLVDGDIFTRIFTTLAH